MSEALANAFRSNAAPAFPEIVSNLFHNSNQQQRAGLLNSLLSGAGPGALGSLLTAGGGRPSLTSEQTQQHPTLMKALGAAAMWEVLRYMANWTRS